MKLDKGYYSSPRWSYEILDCAMPMTFDTYSNCAHQCVYCFSFFQRAVGATADDYLHHRVRAVDVEKVKRMFIDPDNYAGQFKNYIKRRMTLQWGGLSDGFDWYEKKFGVSLELLRFFKEIDYPVSISTKGVWFLDDPAYTSVIKDMKNSHWKYSIITANEEHAAKLEMGTPTTAERMEAMRKLNELGVGATTLRFRPFILGTSEDSIDPLFEKAAEVGCYSVTTEFLTWESRASNVSRKRLEIMSEILGYDVWEFYKKNSSHATGLMRLNYDLKRPYIKRMKEKAAEVGLKFFVSDAHHKEDSYHAGCCGLPESGPLSNVNRGQYAHAILIAKEKGFVRWSDISEKAFELLSEIPVVAAEGFNYGSSQKRAKRQYHSMYDYMHDIWNTPKSWLSPARYFGGALVPSTVDENGDIVYLYNKPFIEDGTRIESVNQLAIELRIGGKPGAERYDEMMADGDNFGHVAYPVVVFSKGRAGKASTIDLLDKARIQNVLVFVPEEEADAYQNAYPNADIIMVPKSFPGIRGAKQYAYEFLKSEGGYPAAWFLDDNISEFTKDGVPCSARAVMSWIERFAQDYNNISVVGVSSSQCEKPFQQNTMPKRGMLLVSLETGTDFSDEKVEVYEDIDFVLSCSDTHSPVSVCNYSFTKTEQPGGASSLYLQGAWSRSVQYLHKKYPTITKLTPLPKPFNYDIVVMWTSLQVPLRSKHVESLISEKE